MPRCAMLLTTLVWMIITPFADAQFILQGGKLVGTGGIIATKQGAAVAVSSDGNTAAVGGPDDNDATGATWIFVRANGVWNQQGGKLVGTGGVKDEFDLLQQGSSVAISADGNTVVTGAPYDNNDMGTAWIFARTNGVWTQQAKLVGSGGSSSSQQGTSVALSADGNTAIIGAVGDNSFWTFTRAGGVWSQKGQKTSESFDCFGSAAALSADGNTALVGSFCEGSVGAAWVFTQTSGGWSQGTRLVGGGTIGDAYEGLAVALSSDGNTALVGGYWDNNFVGAAWVFSRINGVWSPQSTKLAPGVTAGSQPHFGTSVALSGDGNTAFVGGPADNNFAGAVWEFSRSNGTWNGQAKFSGSNGDALGASAAISADGTTAIIGATGFPEGAWVYSRNVAGGGPSPSPTALIGIFRPPTPVGGALGFFVVDSNGNYGYDAGDKVRQFGLAGDTPVAGDWDGTGTVRLGVFRCPAPGAGICTWYLDQNNNGQWDGTAGGDISFQFGLPGDVPVVGDWNGNGISKVGVMRCPATGQPGVCSWFLDILNLRAPSGNFFVGLYGVAGDQPAVGHWSGSGGTIPVDNIGVFRTGQWILNSSGSGSWSPSDLQYFYGLPGDIPVVGKWQGTADKRIGVFRCPAVGQAGTCTWILNTTGNGTFSGSDFITSYGLSGDKPIVGSWTVQ